MDLSVSGAHRRRTFHEDDLGGTTAPPTTSRSNKAPPRSVDAHVDGGIADAVKNAHPLGDGVLYVGMNEDSAGLELKALQAATGGNVTAVLGHAGASVETKFGTFDLTKNEQVHAFAQKLVAYYGLSPDKADSIEKLLLSNTASRAGVVGAGRDEIARVALYMARAESGRGPMPSRLVLSGHSAGGDMWGDKAGEFDLMSVAKLGQIFPGAAKQIEDIHFAGCFTTRELQTRREQWQAAFPNLKTLWGYDGYSQHAPINDLLAWEAISRGHNDSIGERALVAHGNANAWSAAAGFVDPKANIDDLRAAAAGAETRFADYVSGRVPIHDPHAPQIHDDYSAYQRLGARGDAAAAAKANTLLRVRFYEKSIRGEFAQQYGGEVGRAFEALGLAAPDFSKLSRQEALAKIDEFRRAAASRPTANVARAAALLDGLANLDPNLVSSGWCH